MTQGCEWCLERGGWNDKQPEIQKMLLSTEMAPEGPGGHLLSTLNIPAWLESEEAQKEGKNLAVMKTCCTAYGQGME